MSSVTSDSGGTKLEPSPTERIKPSSMRSRDVVLFGKADDGLFAVAPNKDACIVGQFDPGQFLGGRDKFQTARGYVKERFGNRAFP